MALFNKLSDYEYLQERKMWKKRKRFLRKKKVKIYYGYNTVKS